ncbi:hypothetical protein NL676_004532 [Syzygium grande]|nr:hypothetical protein NL676_004532 [Syzygium grande]
MHSELFALRSNSQSFRQTKQSSTLWESWDSSSLAVSLNCALLILSYAGHGDIAAGSVLFRQTVGHSHTLLFLLLCC